MNKSLAGEAIDNLKVEIHADIKNSFFKNNDILFLKCNQEEFKQLEYILFKQEYPKYLKDLVVKYIIITLEKVDSIPEVYTYKLIDNNDKYYYVTSELS